MGEAAADEATYAHLMQVKNPCKALTESLFIALLIIKMRK